MTLVREERWAIPCKLNPCLYEESRVRLQSIVWGVRLRALGRPTLFSHGKIWV